MSCFEYKPKNFPVPKDRVGGKVALPWNTLGIYLLGVEFCRTDCSVLFVVKADGVAVEPSAGDNVDDLAAGSAGNNVVFSAGKRNRPGIAGSKSATIAKG